MKDQHLNEIAANAIVSSLRDVAGRFGEVADTTWGDDAGPSFAVLLETGVAFRVIVTSEPDDLGFTAVYGPYSSEEDDDWVEITVEESQSDEGDVITSTSEFERILRDG